MAEAVTGIQRFSRYAIVGVGSNVTLYLLFLLLVWGGLAPVLVSGMVYILGVTLSYIFNRMWTFSSERDHSHDLPRFLGAYGVGLVVTLISMWILVDPLGPAIAQLVTIFITAVSIYAMLNLLRFGR